MGLYRFAKLAYFSPMMKFSYRFGLVYTHLNVRANEVTNSVFFFSNFHPLKLSEVVIYNIKKKNVTGR